MDTFIELLPTLLSYIPVQYATPAAYVIAASAAITTVVKKDPKSKSGSVARKVLDLFALNFGNAKNEK